MALRGAGASVEQIDVADGPDLVVGFRGVTYMIEVKSPERAGDHREHLAAQAAWRDRWRGGPVAVVETPTGALVAIGAM
jgi:hypothetical protein